MSTGAAAESKSSKFSSGGSNANEGEYSDDDDQFETKELTCPITQELFCDPVIAADGHSYERQAVLRWFGTGRKRSPVTNDLLEDERVTPNHCLRRLVLAYRLKQGVRLLQVCQRFVSKLGQRENVASAELFAQRAQTKLVFQICDIIDNNGAKIDCRDEHGDTALMILLQLPGKSHTDPCGLIGKLQAACVDELLARGASVGLANDHGYNAIELARRNRCALPLCAKLSGKLETENQRVDAEREAKRRTQEAYREEQERRRKEAEEVSPSLERPGSSRAQLGDLSTVGFFPSLFGLLFSNVRAASDSDSAADLEVPRRQNTQLVEPSVVNGTVKFLFGNVDMRNEDTKQVAFMSNSLVGLCAVVLLSFLLL